MCGVELVFVTRGGARINCQEGQSNLGGPWRWWFFSVKIFIEALIEHYFLVKDDENANFNNLVAWNTPYFLLFSFFEILRGQLHPRPHDTAPVCDCDDVSNSQKVTVL